MSIKVENFAKIHDLHLHLKKTKKTIKSIYFSIVCNYYNNFFYKENEQIKNYRDMS